MTKEENKQAIYPFSAIVGQEDFKLALLLNLVDPLIGGVLAVGDKGTGKTTLIRSLADLMGNQTKFPFVNLPIGVSEDRLIGNIDLEQLINTKKEVVNIGLMAQAHQGILYVDEVNLLQDYLTDILLDAAASGRYHLEREGVSRSFDSQFCLVGSMNPEEGSLRPQLKDRFGLSVVVTTPKEAKVRQQVIKQRLSFDDNAALFCAEYIDENKAIVAKIEQAKGNLSTIKISDEIIAYCSELSLQNQVEGLRADILLLKTARAYAAYQNAVEVTRQDVDKIASFVLNHRSNLPPQNQNAPQNQNKQEQKQEPPPSNTNQSKEDNVAVLMPQNDFQKTKEQKVDSLQNTYQTKEDQGGSDLKADVKKSVSQYLATDRFELKNKRRSTVLKPHHIFLIDASGSMLKDQVIAYAKGVVSKLSTQTKTQNTQFSVVSLFDGEAQILTKQTGVLSEVETVLQDLKTGGKTNLSAGFKQVKNLCSDIDCSHALHIVTDGKLNENDHVEDVVLAFQTYCKGIHFTQVVDAEKGIVKIGVAAEFARQVNASYELLITGNE